MSKTYFIYKRDGSRVKFNENKILSTCIRAGASKKTAKLILKKVKSKVYQDISSTDIYKHVLQAISEEKALKALHQRYQLKSAIMRMGPALTSKSQRQLGQLLFPRLFKPSITHT